MDLFSLTRRWFLILREKPLDDHGSHLCPFKALDQRIIIKDHSKYHWMSMEKIIDIQDTVSFKHLFVVFLLFSVPISFSIFFHDINIYWISFKHIYHYDILLDEPPASSAPGRLMYVREYYEDMNGRGRRFWERHKGRGFCQVGWVFLCPPSLKIKY